MMEMEGVDSAQCKIHRHSNESNPNVKLIAIPLCQQIVACIQISRWLEEHETGFGRRSEEIWLVECVLFTYSTFHSFIGD